MITKQLTPQQRVLPEPKLVTSWIDSSVRGNSLTHLEKISFQVETLHLDSLIFLKRSIFERSNIMDECAQDEDNVFLWKMFRKVRCLVAERPEL